MEGFWPKINLKKKLHNVKSDVVRSLEKKKRKKKWQDMKSNVVRSLEKRKERKLGI